MIVIPKDLQFENLQARITELELAIYRAMKEIGIPNPDYAAPITNAYEILVAAMREVDEADFQSTDKPEETI